MAGNAKEWTASAVDSKRMILGGGFNEPSYMFNDLDAQPPFERRATYGFRCAKYMTPPAPENDASDCHRDQESRDSSGQRRDLRGVPESVPLRSDAAWREGRIDRRRGRLAQGDGEFRCRVRQRTRARVPVSAEERVAALPDDRLFSGGRCPAAAVEPRPAPERRRLSDEERPRGALPDLQRHVRARSGRGDGTGRRSAT